MLSPMIRQNFLSANRFQFKIHRLPHVSFFTQTANIPGVSLGATTVASPFLTAQRHGDKLSYDDLQIGVRVDEDLQVYREIHDWLVGLSAPENFDQYAKLLDGEGPYSDATLVVLTSKGNPAFTITFKDIFPTSIGSVEFNSTESDPEAVLVNITFKHNGVKISPLTIT